MPVSKHNKNIARPSHVCIERRPRITVSPKSNFNETYLAVYSIYDRDVSTCVILIYYKKFINFFVNIRTSPV